MKFVSFLLKGQPKFGVSDGKNITDLTGKIKGAQTLKELIINNSINEAKEFSKKIQERLTLMKSITYQ